MRYLSLLLSCTLASLLLWLGGRALLPLLALPVCAVLLVIFARTLTPGQTPLITQLANRFHTHLSPQAIRYTRWVTWAWALFFTLVLLELVLLWLTAPNNLPVAGLINSTIAVVLFIAEFWLRRVFITDMVHAPFRDYIRFLRRHGVRPSSHHDRPPVDLR